jgi:hypothetical protein
MIGDDMSNQQMVDELRQRCATLFARRGELGEQRSDYGGPELQLSC